MAKVIIRRVEEALLPGLSQAIEVQDVGTPLTNLRYTGNYRGAIYGWDQTLNNSGTRRVGHATPVENLYLVGAWSRPGHGYGGVLQSGWSASANRAGVEFLACRLDAAQAVLLQKPLETAAGRASSA
jgi:phytoene dehydrogenase-like protein